MSAGAPGGRTRRAFIGGAAAGAALLASAGPPRAAAVGSAEGDVAILSLALALEHLQAAFYTEAERRGTLGPIGARVSEALGGVERAHVAVLTDALGSRAVPPPLFDFRDATTDEAAFIRTAVAFEDLAAATHLHQMPLLVSPDHRALLASIHTVDAGHASWIRLQAGAPPVSAALDDPVPDTEATGLLVRGGYVSPRPGTPPGGPWTRDASRGPALLSTFPLGRRPAASRPPASPGQAIDDSTGGPPWGVWAATTGVLSALVLGGLGLRARHGAGAKVVVVGPDEGPRVSQHAAAPPSGAGAADDPGGARTTGVPRSRTPKGTV